MITIDQNIALLTVGEAAVKNSKWADYANYCFDREKGLRKNAFAHLEKFLQTAEQWTLDEKIDFVKFLFPFCENFPQADYGPFPQPLSEKLIKPTLTAWCSTEQTDSTPFRWFGRYYRNETHLFRALELNPSDDLARQTLIRRWIYGINYSVHHLPEYYIGNPEEDVQLGEGIKDQIRQLTTSEMKEYWTKNLEEGLELVRNYIEWKSSQHANFEKWGKENNKQTG
ncbi:MAG: hypothetical protein LBV26_08600 [Bacteroidales bacterium]|jgi:hypothetical protein|nr:hypothetical protein [Bacteroidales bacterium]